MTKKTTPPGVLKEVLENVDKAFNGEFQWTPASLQALVTGDFANCLVAGLPGGIEEQEKQGQDMLLKAPILPRPRSTEDVGLLEALGVQFHEKVDDLFVHVTLPEGWGKRKGDNQFWSYLVDDKGRERASLFYKAAFYDRRSKIFISQRYRQEESSTSVRVMDYGRGTEPVEIYKVELEEGMPWEDYCKSCKKVEEWLGENYPEHKDPSAYWE